MPPDASRYEMQEPALAGWTGDLRSHPPAPAESSSEWLQLRSRQPLENLGTHCSQFGAASHLGSACTHPVASLGSCLPSLRDGLSHVTTSALQSNLADSSCLPAAFHHSLPHDCCAARHGQAEPSPEQHGLPSEPGSARRSGRSSAVLKPNPQHSWCCCLTMVWPPAAPIGVNATVQVGVASCKPCAMPVDAWTRCKRLQHPLQWFQQPHCRQAHLG